MMQGNKRLRKQAVRLCDAVCWVERNILATVERGLTSKTRGFFLLAYPPALLWKMIDARKIRMLGAHPEISPRLVDLRSQLDFGNFNPILGFEMEIFTAIWKCTNM
jgi:hypothetical protein